MRCGVTGLSRSYAYKKGCRCEDCRAKKAEYTARDTKAAERSRAWHKANPEQVRAAKTRWREKTWLSKYTELREKQDDCCAICQRKTSVGTLSPSPKLHIDHCHSTGKIRGLLCGNCNVALGHFQDSTELLQRAIKYLTEKGDVYDT